MLSLAQQEDKKHVLEVLEQQNMKLILKSLKDLPKSAQQLASDCDIPLSTTYRMVSELALLNIIRIKRILNESGRWEKRFKCNEFLVECIRSECYK